MIEAIIDEYPDLPPERVGMIVAIYEHNLAMRQAGNKDGGK